MISHYSAFMGRFARHGVLHRERVKNNPEMLKLFVKCGFVQKIYRSGRVFYELTEAAVPLLEQYRKKLLEEVKLCLAISPSSRVFEALLNDVRFLDERNLDADPFLFLGDWQLTRLVTPSRLELAKLRFYKEHVEDRVRKIA
jgi:hypothetical protein